MRLRRILPLPLWQKLRDSYWKWFWKREEREEERALGRPALQPIAGSERAVLAERIADFYPFSSLLEVGCSYGQNFLVYAGQYPKANFLGVDSDNTRIEEGRQLLLRHGISHVLLKEGDAGLLDKIEDKSFDVVISCALLLYISPENIQSVLREMLRVGSRRLLIVEQHIDAVSNEEQVLGQFVARESTEGGYWLRDYFSLLKRFVPEDKILLRKVPSPRWEQERWKDLAYLIEVDLE